MVRKTREEAEKTRRDIIDAARRVFYQYGVVRSTLDKIAKEAGVTRGAVYWHFENKAELFFAMREDVFEPMTERTDAIMLSDSYANPLEAIEAAIKEFFRILEECPVLREVFEIMISRCEYVDEFAGVEEEVGRPGRMFLNKMELVYQQAAAKGWLREGLDPLVAAQDTWAFCTGLLHLRLGHHKADILAAEIPGMIAAHMALRRR